MLQRRLVIACCLLGANACKDDPPAATTTAEDSPEAKRKGECERFATDMARTGLIAGQVLVSALDDDPESASRGRDEMKAGAQQMRRELFDKCMQWPDEVMECLPPLGILKDGCEERLLAAVEGAKPPPKDVPLGPAPAWSFTLEHTPRALEVASDGTVLVVVDDALLGLRDGKVAWRNEGVHGGWLRLLQGVPGAWVAGIEDRVVGLDASDGKERWSATLPPDAGADLEEGTDLRAKVRAVALLEDGLLVGDSEARFFRIDPARCLPNRKGGTGPCIAADGRLPDEELDDRARLLVDGDIRYLWESGVVRSFGADWQPRMTARAHYELSQVAAATGRLVLVVDDDVVELDPAQCRSEAAFGPSEWPQPGALVIGSSECDDCVSPPPGCRRWRTYLDQVSGEAPALLDDGAVVVHADGYTLALDQGNPRWKASTRADGPVASDGKRVFGYSAGLRDDDPPGLFEVADDDGTLRWLTPLTAGYDSDVRLVVRGSWLVAALEQTVIALPLPPG